MSKSAPFSARWSSPCPFKCQQALLTPSLSSVEWWADHRCVDSFSTAPDTLTRQPSHIHYNNHWIFKDIQAYSITCCCRCTQSMCSKIRRLLYSLLQPTTKHYHRLIWDVLVFPCTGVDTMVDNSQLTQGGSNVRQSCQSAIVGGACTELSPVEKRQCSQ